MLPSRSRLAVGALFCFASPALWAATSLPPLKVDPRLLGQPAPRVSPPPAAPVTPLPPAQPEAARELPPAPAEPTAPPPAVSAPPAPSAAPVLPPKSAAPATSLQAPPAKTAVPAMPVPAQAKPATVAPQPMPAGAQPAQSLAAPEPAGTPLPLHMTEALPTSRPASEAPTPLFVSAMTLQGHQDREVEAEGDVELRKLGLRVNADAMRYDVPTDELFAKGNVRIQGTDALVRGPELQLQVDSFVGYMSQPQYMLATEHARGQADQAEFLSRDEVRLSNGSFTTCSPGQDDWFIRASELHLDRTTQEGVARDARVEFMGVPLLYTPWISFPLNEQRKSGLLPPSFGTTDSSGTEVTLPYYWNIAPNYDATFTPRWMAKRGVQLGGEFRYLWPTFSGSFQGEVLPNDRATGASRNAVNLQHQQTFGYGFAGGLNIQHVSDDNYFRDLSTLVAKTSQVILPREGVLTYNNGGLGVLGRLERFQVLQDPLSPITPPYDREPQLLLGYNKLDVLGTDLRLTSEYSDFRANSLVSGKRFYFAPNLSLPLSRSYGHITPRIGLNYTRYSLDDSTTNLPDSTGTLRSYSTDATRTLPIFSVDSGLTFERDASLFSKAMVQTLEPRLYYLYVPYKDQNNLPSFDTGEADFNFAQIFSDNRFSGNDRISDANQVTLALTSRYLEPSTGRERLRAMVGQRINFTNPRVTLVSAAPQDRRSDFLASLGGLIAPGWSLDSALEYNPNDNQSERYNVGGQYAPEPGKVANLAYRFNRNSAIRQIDASGQWPLSAQWQSLARWNYSLEDNRLLEGLVGLEYSKNCWALRVVAHRFAASTQQTTNAFFVQLELSGLSKLGANPLSLLRQNIEGYTRPELQLGTYDLEDF